MSFKIARDWPSGRPGGPDYQGVRRAEAKGGAAGEDSVVKNKLKTH